MKPQYFYAGCNLEYFPDWFCGEKRTNQIIRDTIKDQLDIFINDYLSVNPKGKMIWIKSPG